VVSALAVIVVGSSGQGMLPDVSDPCAVGTTLAMSGVDFTAHVIGFDVEEVER
jgi:hypothetical protein